MPCLAKDAMDEVTETLMRACSAFGVVPRRRFETVAEFGETILRLYASDDPRRKARQIELIVRAQEEAAVGGVGSVVACIREVAQLV